MIQSFKGGARRNFWEQALNFKNSVTPFIFLRVLGFGLFACVIQFLSNLLEKYIKIDLGIEANPFEIAGAVLGVLLVFRTNAGYDRWWEARKLWGGIVNQSRNLTLSALSYGPRDSGWRSEIAVWIAVFPHVCRASLRGEKPDEHVTALVGSDKAAQIADSNHGPSFVSFQISRLLQQAVKEGSMNQIAFMQIEEQRSLLIDHIGGCERIMKTPLPLVYAIKIRNFIVLFLLALPFALLHRLNSQWLIPLVTMGVAYPLLALDQIGVELQNPFPKKNLSHLPLDDISATIEKNIRGLCSQGENPTLFPPALEEAESAK